MALQGCLKARLSNALVFIVGLQGSSLTFSFVLLTAALKSNVKAIMSFGVSVGDFITVGRLIQDIVSSLRASSISEYNELIIELHGLQRALNEIEHLKCHPSQEPAISGIKVAALMCQYPLEEFASKLKRFESLGLGQAGHASRFEKVKMWSTKLRWGFCMKEEVMKVRGYLVAHVGSLNMRLITQGL